MKIIILGLGLSILPNDSPGQNALNIIKEFQKGNMSFVAKHSTVPFAIKNIGPTVDTIITDKTYIYEYLNLIRDIITQEALNKSTIIEHSSTSISLEFRSYNCQGELESESVLTFYFTNDKNVLLNRLALSG